MAETKTSQAQQNFLPFDPMAIWGRMAQDNVDRVQQLYGELASYEAKAYERAKVATNQLSDLANESMTYAIKLAGEWRDLSIEATKRSSEMFKAKA